MTYSSGLQKPIGTVLSDDYIVTPSNDTNIIYQMRKTEKDDTDIIEEEGANSTSPLFIQFNKSNDINTANTGYQRS